MQVWEPSAAMGALVLRRPRGGELGRVELDDLAIGGSRLDVPRLELHNHGILENVQAREASDCQKNFYSLCLYAYATAHQGNIQRSAHTGSVTAVAM